MYVLACSVGSQGTSVLAAVEAKPAAPVLAVLAAPTASARTADELGYGSQASETKSPGVYSWRFKSKNSALN